MSNATFTFGRFNPPTESGHGKLVQAVQDHAESTGGHHYIFATHSQDKKKNPLTHAEKTGAMRKLFPTANVVDNGNHKTIIDVMKHLEKKGHTHVTMVAGSDRVDELHKLLNNYNGKDYKFKKVNVVSAGHRDPDSEGSEGMSASKLRGLVAAGKKDEFVSHYSDKKLGADLHDKVKKGMQMESFSPVGIFLIGGPGSGKDYVLNNIFSRFDLTEIQVEHLLNGLSKDLVESNRNIVINGALDADKISAAEAILEGYNLDYVYVSVTNKVSRDRNARRANPLFENKRLEKWYRADKLARAFENAFVFNNSINLNESGEMEKVFFAAQIEKILSRLTENGLALQEAPKLPEKYTTGLTSKEIAAKNRHITRNSKLSDRDPNAYEDMPGDKRIREKGIPQSKYTKAYHAKFGEQTELSEKWSKKYKSSIDCNNPKGFSQKAHCQSVKKEDINLEEASGLANKAKNSGVSVGTLRKVYRRGVAAWNSGHRPGTTPQQWGMARVNSYIAKGKGTYHGADKDLHEQKVANEGIMDIFKKETQIEKFRRLKGLPKGGKPKPKTTEFKGLGVGSDNHGQSRRADYEYAKEEVDIDQLFEMQLMGTDEYRQHAISMTPGQTQEIQNAYETMEPTDGKEECSCGGKCNGECGCGGTCGGECTDRIREGSESSVRRRFSSIRASIKEAEKESSVEEDTNEIDLTPTLKKRKNPKTVTPGKAVRTHIDGLPVTARLYGEQVSLGEAVQYHLDNKVSFTENVFRPGSDMFFQMIGEAKRLFEEGEYTPADGYEQDLLESDIGEIAEYEGQQVVLDYPIEEGLEECWSGYTQKGMKKKGNRMVPNCVPVNEEGEHEQIRKEYEGLKKMSIKDLRKNIQQSSKVVDVSGFTSREHAATYLIRRKHGNKRVDAALGLKEEDETGGKGIGKPFRTGGGGAVYVKNAKGNVIKVNFSQSGMKKRINEPGRVRSFVARHHCLTNKDRTSASYWACRWPRFFSNTGQQWW
jgi:dephospho-CoA kinase